MIRTFLALVCYGILAGAVGWYYHGHPDKFIAHTGFVGSWIVERLEHVQKCPEGYVCTSHTPVPEQSL